MIESRGIFTAAELGSELGKSEYEDRLESLRVELLNLQFDLQHADFSLIILIAGDDRPGIISATRALHEWMDARYIDTHVMLDPGDAADLVRPQFWRYWRRLPPHGRIGLFLGAWPMHVVKAAIDRELSDLEFDGALDHSERFERQLYLEGSLVLKFWLHLPKTVLEKRLDNARKEPGKYWRIEERDWEVLENYDEGLAYVERTLRRTNTQSAPWSIVESTNRRYRNLTVAEQVVRALAARFESGPPNPLPAGFSVSTATQNLLEQIDLTVTAPEDYGDQVEALQARLAELSRAAADAGIACVMVFEGVDAAGKGGSIRRVTAALPVQNFRVIPIAAPTDEEAARHYLWRFWRHVPGKGNTVIFDRSWYGRVLVERVEGLANDHQWGRAYEEINDFEGSLDDAGIPVMKFWLQIDAEEQLRRFQARAATPYKKYKLTDEDYRNREKWGLYKQAAHDMIARTNTSYAPWNLVASNDKKHARLQVLRTVCDRFEARLEELRGKDWRKNAKSEKSNNNRKSKKKNRKS